MEPAEELRLLGHAFVPVAAAIAAAGPAVEAALAPH